MPNHSLKFHSDANYPKRRSEELRRLKKSVGRGERVYQAIFVRLCIIIYPSIRLRHIGVIFNLVDEYDRSNRIVFFSDPR